jgi:hypothetical protein
MKKGSAAEVCGQPLSRLQAEIEHLSDETDDDGYRERSTASTSDDNLRDLALTANRRDSETSHRLRRLLPFAHPH